MQHGMGGEQMRTLVLDRELQAQLRERRVAAGADRYDEVWEGTYVMAPMPNDEHQQLVSRLDYIFQHVIGWPGLGDVRPGVNVSDRRDNWQQNYRVPDVAVFLTDGDAVNHGTFWQFGPDFVVEIVSRDDPTREKIGFYGDVGARELLIVDREPWRLELLRLANDRLVSVGRSDLDAGEVLESAVLPFTFRLVQGEPRPVIHVLCTETGRAWEV